MKHLTIVTLCVLVIFALLFIIENVFGKLDLKTLIPSIVYLIIIFALVSFGNEKKIRIC